MNAPPTPHDRTAADAWFAAIRARLASPLTGPRGQRGLGHELGFGRHAGPPPADARSAAVLVLLYPSDSQWRLPLILRPQRMGTHAGQVAFPGGMLEEPESLCECAIREAHEELGIAAESLELLGELSPVYIFASNFRVSAFVAGTHERPQFHPDAREVEELLELPVSALWEESRQGRHVIERQGVQFETPHLEWQGRRIWGATRVMLGELACVLADATERAAAGAPN
ncbi:MAG: CoA pyrophosphatase [Pirellulales bacterium]